MACLIILGVDNIVEQDMPTQLTKSVLNKLGPYVQCIKSHRGRLHLPAKQYIYLDRR